jgi:hypothetical protein
MGEVLRVVEIPMYPGHPPLTVWAGNILLDAFPSHFGWVVKDEELVIFDRVTGQPRKRFKRGDWNLVRYGAD